MSNEIETIEAFDDAVRGGTLRHAALQSLDLTGRGYDLARVDVTSAMFLGCQLDDHVVASLHERGALVFPKIPDVPVDAYRGGLYDARELYGDVEDHGYESSLDARAYAWTTASGTPPEVSYTLPASLHDQAISDALDEYLDRFEPTRVVGIMGGHAVGRGTEAYAATAALGRTLARHGFLVVSGGGPGAMEAANLGARFASVGDACLTGALTELAAVPSFRPVIADWAAAAFRVLETCPADTETLGIPTWFYGHEPPNVFATAIAKYCSNAIREDVLLRRCRGGLVYQAGAAGTVQELFQAVTGNYYASDPTTITPLVLVGREQWTSKLPAWDLLHSLAVGRPMADAIALVDTVEEAGEWLASRVA